MLVDPSLEDPERMAAELNRRTGLQLGDIEAVFVTHEHGDHHFGLRHFPAARWLAAPEVADRLNSGGRYVKRVEARLAAVSIEKLAQIGDLIIPGHDNYFLNRR